MVYKTHKYADGGKVVKDHMAEYGGKPTYMGAVKDRVKSMLGMGGGEAKKGVSASADTIKNTREQQMKDLGLADGGKVGSKFDQLRDKLSGRPGVTDPAALAATIGRKKYGAAGMAAKAAAGRRKG